MGKSSKAKKRKLADFQKVKLKAGRKLTKGHETDTSFRAAKVVLVEQLKSKEDSTPLTHRRLSLQDLCNQMRHHSASTRTDALRGLKELLVDHGELLIQSMSAISSAIFPLVSDMDSDVRVALLAVLYRILSSLEDHALWPHMSLLVSHIACGLTHQLDNVKSFSLNLIASVLIPTHPALMARSWRLVESLLKMLPSNACSSSSSREDTTLIDTSGSSSAVGGSKILSRKNKISMVICFTRLTKILLSDSIGGKSTCRFEKSDPALPAGVLERPQWRSPFVFPIFIGDGVGGDMIDNLQSSMMNDVTLFIAWVDRLIPFLHDCWVEATELGDEMDLVDFCFTDESLTLMDFILRVHCATIRHASAIITDTRSNDSRKATMVRAAIRRLYDKKTVEGKYELLFPVAKRSASTTGRSMSKQKHTSSKVTTDTKRLSMAAEHVSVVSVNSRLVHMMVLLGCKMLSEENDAESGPKRQKQSERSKGQSAPSKSRKRNQSKGEKYSEYLQDYLGSGDKSDGSTFALVLSIVSAMIEEEDIAISAASNIGDAGDKRPHHKALMPALIDSFLSLKLTAAMKDTCFEVVAGRFLSSASQIGPPMAELSSDVIEHLVNEMIDLMPIWLSAEEDFGT